MATRIQLRRDISTNWISNNPILAEGEIGIETDTNKLKIGNGISTWNILNYYGATLSKHSELTLDDGTNPHGTTKSDIGLSNVDNTSDIDKPISTSTQNALDLKLDKVTTSGVERAYIINADGSPGTKATSEFKDVLEFANLAAFPTTGETGKIYLALDTNKTYRWSGSAYVQIGGGIDFPVDGKTYGVKDGLPVEIKSQIFTINLGRFVATPTGAGVYTKHSQFAGFYNPTLSTGVSNHLLLSPDALSVIGKVPFDCSLLDIVLTMSTVNDASFSIWKTAPNSYSGIPIELYHVDDTTNTPYKQFGINSDIILKDSFIHIFYTKRNSTSAYPTGGFLTFKRL